MYKLFSYESQELLDSLFVPDSDIQDTEKSGIILPSVYTTHQQQVHSSSFGLMW